MMRVGVTSIALLALAGCGDEKFPQLVMANDRTGAVVDCQVPDLRAAPAGYLLSRACVSACKAHGFIAMPSIPAAPAIASIPALCSE